MAVTTLNMVSRDEPEAHGMIPHSSYYLSSGNTKDITSCMSYAIWFLKKKLTQI